MMLWILRRESGRWGFVGGRDEVLSTGEEGSLASVEYRVGLGLMV